MYHEIHTCILAFRGPNIANKNEVTIYFQRGCQDNLMGKEMVLRQLDSHMQKNEAELLPHIKYKI